MALRVGFGRRLAEHDRVGVDDGEILPTLDPSRDRPIGSPVRRPWWSDPNG